MMLRGRGGASFSAVKHTKTPMRDTCIRSTTESDNWRLDKVRIAAAENQVWGTVLTPLPM